MKGIKSVKSFQLAHEDFMWVGLEHTPQSYNFLRQQQIIQYIFTSIEEYFIQKIKHDSYFVGTPHIL